MANPVGRPTEDVMGRRFGKLVVVERTSLRQRNKFHTAWVCQCDCGRRTGKVPGYRLKKYKSCGFCDKRKRKYPDAIYLRIYAAKKRKTWALDDDYAVSLMMLPCHYCGTESKLDTWNGLDRVDSSRGYSSDNVVPCCTMCNTMKMDCTLDEFKQNVERVYRHFVLGAR